MGRDINYQNVYYQSIINSIIVIEIKFNSITLLRINQLLRNENARCRFSLSSLARGQYLPGWSELTFKQDLTNFQIV